MLSKIRHKWEGIHSHIHTQSDQDSGLWVLWILLFDHKKKHFDTKISKYIWDSTGINLWHSINVLNRDICGEFGYSSRNKDEKQFREKCSVSVATEGLRKITKILRVCCRNVRFSFPKVQNNIAANQCQHNLSILYSDALSTIPQL